MPWRKPWRKLSIEEGTPTPRGENSSLLRPRPRRRRRRPTGLALPAIRSYLTASLLLLLTGTVNTVQGFAATLPIQQQQQRQQQRRQLPSLFLRSSDIMMAAAAGSSAETETETAPGAVAGQGSAEGPASEPSSAVSASASPNWRTLCRGDDGSYPGAPAMVMERAGYSRACFEDALELYDRFTECNDSFMAGPIKAALNWLDHAYRLYGPESVICSFNGGKDAVVILHLVRAAHAHYYRTCVLPQQEEGNGDGDGDSRQKQKHQQEIIRPRVIYFEHDDEFPEIVDFLHKSVRDFDLDMIAFEKGIKFQHGLKVLVDHNVVFRQGQEPRQLTARAPASALPPPFPLAFVLGTRQGDPNAMNQDHFAPSSHYMPPFMRVNPILEWTYGHVWHFLRLFKLPYCVLYDLGYTSLGTTKDTLPCPALAVAGINNSDNLPKFWPAYMLRDWEQERAGRIDKKKDGGKPKTPSKKSSKKSMSGAASASKEEGADRRAISRTDSYMSGRLSMLSEVRVNVPKGAYGDEQKQQERAGGEGVDEKEGEEIVDDSSALSFSTDTVNQRTVGLLIVGNEILKGYTADSNTQAAAAALREQNVLLQRVVVVSDDFDDIVQEIRRLQKEVDVIITSGGVGPTHDDITIKSIAAALDLGMSMHDEMKDLLREKMKTKKNGELTEAQMKMATLPTTSKLRYLSDKSEDWPILQCQNLFILPGIPEVFAYKIRHVAKYLSCQLERTVAYKVVLSVDENSIVPILNRVVEKHPNVIFGSYPFVSHPDFKTVLTVEGKLVTGGDLVEATTASTAAGLSAPPVRRNSKVFSRELIDNSKRHMDTQVQLALDELLTALPEGSVLRVDNDDMLFV